MVASSTLKCHSTIARFDLELGLNGILGVVQPATTPRIMQEYAFQVKLVAIVRVRAADEALARKVVPAVLGSPGTVEIRLANESNTSLGLNATVTNVDFSADGLSAMLLHRNEKKVKRRRR